MEHMKGALPCPVCGSEISHGVTAEGKHVVYCEDHMQCSAAGDTKESAIKNFNLRLWSNCLNQEHHEDDLEQDDDE